MFKFQIVSDIHVESAKLSIKDIIIPSAPFLIIAGDLGRVENTELYKKAVRELCGMFKKVFLVPGNHEYYCLNRGTKKLTISDINKFLKDLSSEPEMSNFYPLIDESIVVNLFDLPHISRDVPSVMIHGSTFWSYVPYQHYIQSSLYTESNGVTPVIVNAEVFNEMHHTSIRLLERSIQCAARENMTLLVVTHYAPSFNGTLDKKYVTDWKKPAMGSPKNYMYCSSSDHLVDNKCIVSWVYGHTGYNGCVGKLVTNQIDRETGKKDAVLRFNVQEHIAKTLPPPHLVLFENFQSETGRKEF